MRFLIFIPDRVTDDPNGLNRLDTVGLGRLKPGAVFRTVDNGPDGGTGLVASWPRAGEAAFDYDADSQSWRSAVKLGELPADRYWAGVDVLSPPTARELAWKNQAPGEAVVLGDGGEWILPYVTSLTLAFGEGADGGIGLPARSEMIAYAEIGQRVFATLVAGAVELETTPIVIELLVKGLQLNYALPVEVISELRLLTTASIQPLAQIALSGLQTATANSIAEDIARSNAPAIPSEFGD